MSITIPSGLELTEPHDMLGNLDVKKDPVHTLMRRTNYLYATYSPALLQACPYFAADGSYSHIFPVTPSADGLRYQPALAFSVSATSDVSVSIWTSEDGSTWDAVTGWAARSLACTTGQINIFTDESDFIIDADVVAVKIQVSHDNRGQLQLHAFTLYPSEVASVSAGATASGFIPYDDQWLATSGAPVTTEMVNRTARNVHAVVSDRVQCVTAWSMDTDDPIRMRTSEGAVRLVHMGQIHLPGNARGTLTVKLSARGGSGSNKVTFSQVDGASVTITTNTDSASPWPIQSGTFEVVGEFPVIKITALVTADLYIHAFNVTWVPNYTSSDDALTEAAPPARLAYLGDLEDLTMRAAVHSYAAPSLLRSGTHSPELTYPAGTSGAYMIFNSPKTVFALLRVPPGTYAIRPFVSRCAPAVEEGMPKTRIGTHPDGGTDEQRVDIPCTITGGVDVFPPDTPIGSTQNIAIDAVADQWSGTTPNGLTTSAPDGDYLIQTLQSDKPSLQVIGTRHCFAIGGVFRFLDDLTGL